MTSSDISNQADVRQDPTQARPPKPPDGWQADKILAADDKPKYQKLVDIEVRLMQIPPNCKGIPNVLDIKKLYKGWGSKPDDDPLFFTPDTAVKERRGEMNIAAAIPYGCNAFIIDADHAEAEELVSSFNIDCYARWRTRSGGYAHLVVPPVGYEEVKGKNEVPGLPTVKGANRLNFSVRAQGRYQMMPDSTVDGKSYEWLEFECKTATAEQLDSFFDGIKKEQRKGYNKKRKRGKADKRAKDNDETASVTLKVDEDETTKSAIGKLTKCRNIILFSMAKILCSQDFDRKFIIGYLKEINNSDLFEKPWTDETMDSMTDRALKYDEAQRGIRKRFTPAFYEAHPNDAGAEATGMFKALGQELRYNQMKHKKEMKAIEDKVWQGAMDDPICDTVRNLCGNIAYAKPEIVLVKGAPEVRAAQRPHYNIKKAQFEELLISAAMVNPVHPFLNALDGIKRRGDAKWPKGIPERDKLSAGFLQKCYFVEPPYDEVGRYAFPAMIRAMIYRSRLAIKHDTYKYDYGLILQGLSGIAKSELGKVICRPLGRWQDYFTDSIDLSKDHAEIVHRMLGFKLAEVSDMRGIKHTDIDFLKGFMASEADNTRLRFRPDAKAYIREMVMMMTADKKRFLPLTADDIARRFLVIQVWNLWDAFTKAQRLEHLRHVGEKCMEQVWYEQILECDKGTPCYLPDNLSKINEQNVREHKIIDFGFEADMRGLLEHLITSRGSAAYFKPEHYRQYFKLEINQRIPRECSGWLRDRGFECGLVTVDGKREWAWTFPDPREWEFIQGDYVRRS